MKESKRIILIGASGSGKTTLAKQLSAVLNIPHTELDSIYHQANWQPLNDADFIAEVRKRTDASAWILCGNYYRTIGSVVWPHADVIIWCDYSFGRTFGRLLRRTIRNCFTKKELWNGNRESFYTNFLTRKSVMAYMAMKWKGLHRQYEDIYRSPQQFSGVTFIRLKHPRDARRLLDQMSRG
jgi:adenylate kinase family enzyme